MINIYAVNYTDENQVFHDTWTLIQSIPAEATADIALINPSIDLKIDSAETMNFTVQANTKFYNAFHQMKSYIRVDYDNITVFYGRVLTIDTGYFGDRKVQCEGPIAFLNDTYQEGKKESDRNKVSIYEYLSEIISAHNANTVETFKKIYLGEVPGNYSNDISAEQKVTVEDRKFGETSWVTTKSALENLKSHHGGFMMIRCELEQFNDTVGQYGLGNIDLNNRIIVYNDDGTISTERSFSTEIDGHEVLLPTIVNGTILSEEAAIQHYISSGEYLGIFDTVSEADAYAERLHERQNWYYNGRPLVTKLYLDWLQHYTNRTTINQTVAIGKNVIDLNYITEVNNLFTAIIPFGRSGNNNLTIKGYREDIHGANNYLRVDAITQIYTDEQLNSGYHTADDYRNSYNKYGLIFKTVDLSEETTKESLFNKAAEWIKDNYFGGIDSFTVSAIDMHLIGENEAPIMLGNRVNIQYVDDVSVSRVLTCTSIKLDLYNPEKNQYGFGIPSTSLNRSYSVTSKKSASSTPVPSSYNPPPDELDEQAMWEQEVFGWLRKHQVWKKSNGNVEGGPNASSYMNTFLRPAPDVDEEGESKQYLWRPQIASVTGGIVNFAKDENGHPLGTWVKIKKSELTASRILSTGLVQYIKMEYGFDIRNGEASGFGVNMPSIITDDDGGTSIFGPILEDGDGNSLVQKLIDLGKEGKIMDIFEKDGTTLSAWIDDLGDYHYFEKNPDGSIKVDDQGNPIELSVHQINEDVVEVRSKIFTVESDYIQFKSETESNIATIEMTADQIRSEVASADSSLYSTIQQTASAIRSTIADTENGLYNYIQNTASGTRQIIVSTTNRTWIQDTDPTTSAGGGHQVKVGDIWVESTHQGTWDGAEGFNWEHDEGYDWTQIQGAKIWGWQNGKWELVSDQQQVVSYSDVINTAEHYVNLKIAGLVNDEGLLDVYMSKIEQTATDIRSEISDADSTIYSFIKQTRSNILLRVAEQPGHVYSKTQPTKIVYGEGDDKTERDPIDGDLWIDSQMTENWDAAFDLSWGDESGIDWNALRSDKIKVYKNGQWVDVIDGTKLVDDADIEVDHNTAKMYARKLEQVDGELQRYYAELKVDAHSIRSQVDEIYNGLGSRITQTAREIRADVYAENSKVYSAITQTASNIKMEVANTISGVWASFEVTANSIRSDVSAADSRIYSSITQTASSIRLEVASAKSSLYSSITQTATSIRSDVSAANSRIYTSIQQTASSIRMEVNSAVSDYKSMIKQQADRISLVVEGTGSNAKIRPAEIVASINNGASSILLSANHVNISGTVKISDALEVTSAGVLKVKKQTTFAGANYDVSINNGKVTAGNGVTIGAGKSLVLIEGSGESQTVRTITPAIAGSLIKSASVSSDGKTLTLTNVKGEEITFSKATSLDGTWSGTVAAGKSYKVTASPQGTIHYSPQLDGIIYRNDKAWANDKKSFTQTLYVYDEKGEELYEENLSFSTTDSYNKGHDDGYDADHNLFIGDNNYVAKPSSISLSIGQSIEVWPYFKKSDGSTYQWGPKYTISAPSDPHPTRYTLRCTEATPTYPGSNVKNYTFTLQGVYSFGANTNYYFYR